MIERLGIGHLFEISRSEAILGFSNPGVIERGAKRRTIPGVY